jgi:hypothetical protein
MGLSGQFHAPAALYAQERTTGSNWIGGWVDPNVGPDTEARGKFFASAEDRSSSVQSDTTLTELPQSKHAVKVS